MSCQLGRLLKVLVRPSFQPQCAVVHDVSRRGIGLYLRGALPLGSRLALQLRGPHRGLSCVVSAHVVHSTARSGAWLLGCDLSRPLSDDELDSFR